MGSSPIARITTGLLEQMKNIEFPSILDQLKTNFAPRKELDTMFLQLMGHLNRETDQLSDYLCPALANEIEKLKTMMEG